MKEQTLRSIAKAVTWRVLLTISHMINALIVTGSFIAGLKIAGGALIVNTILYILHERAWNIFEWNRRKDPRLEFQEGNPRSITKIFTWRGLVMISNFLVTFIVTGSWVAGAAFMSISAVINSLIYWAHERGWNRIKWGKNSEQ